MGALIIFCLHKIINALRLFINIIINNKGIRWKALYKSW